ncbi:hypothetical protein KKF84_04745 [Myxococcota bacterium]|nr:hypothetical protein [Myxococcota bacterium]
MEKVTIFFHGNCFDGAASAALFKNFYEVTLGKSAQFTFIPLAHEVGFSYDDRMFTGDINVVLDFRYPPSEKVSWWFDHHRTTFIGPDDREHLETRTTSNQFVWNPDAPSNTGLMAKTLAESFGFTMEPWHESLIQWAEMIDAATFETPDVAVELLEPAMAFAFFLEHNQDRSLLVRFIEELAGGSTVDELAGIPFWSQRLNYIRQHCWDMVEDVKGILEVKSRVSSLEIMDHEVSGFNKFIPYYLAPLINYSVALLRMETHFKISVGTNPWSKGIKPDGRPDIGALCKKYGGGGHFAVGGIPFALDQEEKAREAAMEIAEFLREFNIRQENTRKKDIIEESPSFELLEQN